MNSLLGEDGVLLYPSHPTPAPYHGQALVRTFNFAYTGIFNILGLPVTQVCQLVQIFISGQVPLGISSMGVPLGIQVLPTFVRSLIKLSITLNPARLLVVVVWTE